MGQLVGNTSIDCERAQKILRVANGRWGSRLELSRLAGVNEHSGDFYVRALYRSGMLLRKVADRGRGKQQPPFLYRLVGT